MSGAVPADGSTSHAGPADRWGRIEALFGEALEQAPERRLAFLETGSRGDRSLLDEVVSLLAAADAADAYFDELAGRAGVRAQPGIEGRRVGAYRLVRLLGRGGMGAVFLGERADGHFEKRVAIKLLPIGLATEAARRRFLTERRVLAGLEHSNIARLLDGGIEADGTPYFVMEYASGTSIDEYCRRHELNLSARLQLFLQVLDAVAHAHRSGIVHRDLKPANVLVTEEGQVRLVDFGIAKLMQPHVGETLTRPGEGPLTPRYAGPEQLRGEAVSPATDVYALGIMLYELLAGCPPYELDGVSFERLFRIVCEQHPLPPSSRALAHLRRHLRGDLDAIVLRALRKEPHLRYDSAADLRDDVERHLAGRPVLARQGTFAYRASRLVRRHRAPLIGAVTTVFAVLAMLGAWPAPGGVPVLAVGAIEDRTGGDTLRVAQGLPGLLAYGLAGVPGLQIVTTERMNEVRSQFVAAGVSSQMDSIARLAGAGELLEGTLYQSAPDGLRLELRRRDVRTGRVRASYTVAGSEPVALASMAIARVARDLGFDAERVADGSLGHPLIMARRLYEEGLRVFYGGNAGAAAPLFEAALREDSALAMATYYLWRSRLASGERYPGDTALANSARMAAGASERERLLIRATWANALQDRNGLALAESLAVRYPIDPDGHLLLGQSTMLSGDFLGSIRHLQQVVVMDSLSLRSIEGRCRACEALAAKTNAFMLADSGEAAMRVARDWIRRQPTSPDALRQLAEILIYLGRFDEALAVRREAAALNRVAAIDLLFPGRVALFAGRWDEADRLFRESIREGTVADRIDGLWWLALSLREQGKLHEALATELSRRRLLEPSESGAPPFSSLLQGAILLDLGRAREAAALFDSIASQYEGGSRGWQARSYAWPLTHHATALAAAGDTAGLGMLASTIHGLGAVTRYGMIWNLDGYVNALVLARRGRHDVAEQELRRALYSISVGFSQVNLELARNLLALGRADEAAVVLEAPLRGPIDSGNMYVSRTVLRAEAGRAWEAAGRPDSAAVHYRWVLNAWRDADPHLHARRDSVAARLLEIAGGA